MSEAKTYCFPISPRLIKNIENGRCLFCEIHFLNELQFRPIILEFEKRDITSMICNECFINKNFEEVKIVSFDLGNYLSMDIDDNILNTDIMRSECNDQGL